MKDRQNIKTILPIRKEIIIEEIIFKSLIYHGINYPKFEISNTGILRNIKTGTVYKQTKNHNGYMGVVVSLGSRDNKRYFKIHRCVAETFLPNPNNLPVPNHLDGNKTNNYVENLEWCTDAENTQHAFRMGLAHALKGEDGNASKLTWEDVKYIRENYIPSDRLYGTRGLARKFDVDHTTIMSALHNESWIA